MRAVVIAATVMALAWPLLAVAQPSPTQSQSRVRSDVRPGSLEALVADLGSSDAPRRRFAARELNRVAKLSRKAEFGSLERERTTDALANLEFLDTAAAPICIAHVAADIEVAECAKLLGLLETAKARPVVVDALARTDSRRERRALERTLAILDAESTP